LFQFIVFIEKKKRHNEHHMIETHKIIDFMN
jgi:hypothetical protein